MSRIKYNKKALSGKQIGGGGPRDKQLAHKILKENELLKRVISAEVTKQPEIDLSQYLPLNEVKKKLDEAVASTIVLERKRFEDIQDKLTAANIEIAGLTASLKAKEEIYLQSSLDLEELKYKLDKLYDRISDGSIQHLVGSKMDRPILEDKIFIDPLEKNEGPKLDSHIDIKEDKSSKTDSERDINTDLAKLRNLLKL